MFGERTSVGLDVHARSVAAAAIDGVTGEVRQARLTPAHDQIRSWIAELPGPVAVTYEAGPTGFGLYRTLTAAGVRCVVAAPSKLQRPSGDRVKTDAKDAVHLARLLRLGELPAVTVPSVDQEAARDLVRAREDCRGDLMRARHRLSKLLLRQGIVYSGGQAWTGRHDRWLRQQRFDTIDNAAGVRFRLRHRAERDRAPGPARQGDRRTGRRQRVHRGGAQAELPAGHLHADRVRARRGDRRLASFHRQQHRLFRRSSTERVLLRHVPGAGLDHQDRQYPRPTAARRSRLAPPRPIRARQDHPRPVGTGPTRRPCSRRRSATADCTSVGSGSTCAANAR